MNSIISACGYRCDLCLAYRPNVKAHPENRQTLSDGWHIYFGFRIPPENIICDGCSAIAEKRLDKACPVKPCVLERGLENCAACQDMICDKLRERLVDFNVIQAQYDQPIPKEDRRQFILPYENNARLKKLLPKK